MNDSSINPLLLTSSAHLENVEQLIKNLEKHTFDLDNFDEIASDRNRQELITKSFSVVTSSTMAIDDTPDDNFLIKSISLTNTGFDENVSMDSLLTQRPLFDNDDFKKQQTPPGNDQSLYNDHDTGFTWDDQYDTRANYRLTFSTDKLQQNDQKIDKPHKHRHRHRHHRHNRTPDSQSSSTYSDDGLAPNSANNMNDWSMRSSVNAFDQSVDLRDNKTPIPISPTNQQTTFVRSQSHPTCLSPNQQSTTNNNNNNNNNNLSPNSSTTSSSSSASWKRMKDSQRATPGVEVKDIRPPSPLNLYKIFQQKNQMAGSSPRSAFQYYRQQSDSVVPNNTDSMTISGEKVINDRPKGSFYQKKQTSLERPSSQTNPSTDQAIQTSIVLDSSSNSQMNSRLPPTPIMNQLQSHAGLNSPHNLAAASRPSPSLSTSSAINKSLPDLGFISQYSKELPRSRTTSPLPPTASLAPTILTTRMGASPSVSQQQQKQENDRPRTLKSIKRYKNSKHSTEPLGVFFSPQLGKTFAAVPASAVINGTNETPTFIKMKLPPSSYPKVQKQSLQQEQRSTTLKPCLKYGPRAASCDIQAMLQDGEPAEVTLNVPQPARERDSSSPTTKRRCSENDVAGNRSNNLWAPNMNPSGSSDDLNDYPTLDLTREHRSAYDLTALQQQQQNQTKKSVSFSDNIAKHLISPCNPAIQIDTSPDIDELDDEPAPNAERFAIASLHGNQETLAKRPTFRYGDMRRCQTDIIVVDRVHHLHTFTDSPPNEFRLQETDSLAPEQNDEDEDDQTIMEKTHINVIPNTNESPVVTSPVNNKTNQDNPTIEKMTPSNDKDYKPPEQSNIMNASTVTLIPTNDPMLDGLLARIGGIIKRIFEIKRSEKTFFLVNENNSQLDTLLKNDLCTVLQDILEHGLTSQRKDVPSAKQVNLWKIIEKSIDHGPGLQAFVDAKQIAQNASPYWLYKFQAFVFALLNKNELINWLYHFMKQKDVLQRYYQSPDALILACTPPTFHLFDRIMVQLEKLSPLAFRLVYKPESIPANIEEQLNTSTISIHSNKNSPRDWVMTLSKRTTKTLTQPIVPTSPAPASTINAPTQPADTLRSTLSRKLNSIFTRTNTTQVQRKASSAVTAKLPSSKTSTLRTQSPSPSSISAATTATPRRTPVSNVFANATAAATTNKPVIVSSPKLSNGSRTGNIRRGISPSVVVAPSPPPTLNNSATPTPTPSTTAAFQSKIPRPSLNVDKPKSARYRSTAAPPK